MRMFLLMYPMLALAQTPGSLFTTSGPLSNAARDVRAGLPGDIVTIVVSDQATATATGATNSSRQSTGNAQIGSLAGVLAAGNPLASLLDFSNTRKITSQGDTSRTMAFTTTISARVVATTLNGLLVIEATKETMVNSERQQVVLRGLIRAVDVTPANTIRSDQVADLALVVNGRGVVDDAIKRPNAIYRMILSFLPF
jgi:flagellar L-ring protein FlgH